MQQKPIPCERQVGFLFKRRCGRIDRTGCPYCSESGDSSYMEDYAFYRGYGTYQQGSWGSDYYENRDCYSYNPETGNVDFTEADSVCFTDEVDTDYEQDMGAS